MKHERDNLKTSHLDVLDGFRGSLAVWVLLGHLSAATNYSIRIISDPALAVDLFMILSGFLMFYTWEKNLDSKEGFARKALAFYLSRFFRIAPLFYFLLVICWLFLPELNAMERYNAMLLTRIESAELSDRWNFHSFKWWFLHLSFLYGLLPGFENSSPLPEWSLSLEMQYYLIFPILFFLFKKRCILSLSLIVCMLSLVTPRLFGEYSIPGYFAHFGQPSLILYRANAFVAGMVLAAIWQPRERQTGESIFFKSVPWISALLCVAPLSKLVIVGYAFLSLIVFFKIPIITTLLSSRAMRFLGEISYSIYLIHMLVIIYITFGLINSAVFVGLPSGAQFFVGLIFVAPVTVLLSYAAYRLVELPTMKFGQVVANRLLVKSSN